MRRRRHKSPGDVQLNLAAMLDMAFQLLAFFILTFKPAPIEGHFQLHMPSAIPMTDVRPEDTTASTGSAGAEVSAFVETLDIYVTADDRGQVTSVTVGQQTVVAGPLNANSSNQLNRNLMSVFNIRAVPYDRIQLHVDPRLHYEELMKVVDVCTRQTLPDGTPMKQLGFTDLGNR